jgi:hypothetical protein
MVASWEYIILTASADAMEVKINLVFKLDEMTCGLCIVGEDWIKVRV